MIRLLLLGLSLLLVLGGPLAAPASAYDPIIDRSVTCGQCCEPLNTGCTANASACERLCSAAIVPDETIDLEVVSASRLGLSRSRSLESISGKPMPPPPRSAPHLFHPQ